MWFSYKCFCTRARTLLPDLHTHFLHVKFSWGGGRWSSLYVCKYGRSPPPAFFYTCVFLQVVFLQRAFSPPAPPPTGSFFTFEFFYTIRFLSLTLDDFTTRGFLQMFLYRVQSLLPGLYTHFLHVKFPGSFFYTWVLYTPCFSLTPDYFGKRGSFTNVLYRAQTFLTGLYMHSLHVKFSWGGGER